MNSKKIEIFNSILKDLLIRFVGDPSRGERLQEAARKCGWKISIESQQSPEPDDGSCCAPNLVLLDDFPESLVARSAFYRFYQFRGVVFLALNKSPHAMKFLHINALTRLKLIDRDPDSKTLINAIVELARTGRKSPARHAETKSDGHVKSHFHRRHFYGHMLL